MAEKQNNTDSTFAFGEVIPYIRDKSLQLMVSSGNYTLGFARVLKETLPLAQLIGRSRDVELAELSDAIDALFQALSDHPMVGTLHGLTKKMRSENLLPNEKTTEQLIHYLINEMTLRSGVAIPDRLIEEFWRFFNELMAEEELSGLGEVSLDALRILVKAYEPMLLNVINQIKELRRINDSQFKQVLAPLDVLGGDAEIFKRQIRALRHIRTFFEIDPEDLHGQAAVMAQMVREFGPFFIKMAQVAAANADFLSTEMAEALEVFHEDVEAMTPEEVEQAFEECYGQSPNERYYGFNAAKPLKSGSIASVYLAERPSVDAQGRHRLSPVIVKVGRHNLEREFMVGKTVIKLAILSSRYWAPHAKVEPFLESWMQQIDVFVEGFKQELDFDTEAANQQRFADRSKLSDGWRVPKVFDSCRRIIEMEYVENPVSLNRAFDHLPPRKALKLRRKLGKNYLHAVLTHMLLYKEFHGDLHAGNVVVGKDRDLYLIDWGNTVDLAPIWQPTLRYILAVLQADPNTVLNSLYELVSNPRAIDSQRDALRKMLSQTFAQNSASPLGKDVLWVLLQEGEEGLLTRAELVMNLLTGLSRHGITVRGEFLHLSRSLVGMVGSYNSLYQGVSKRAMMIDIMSVLAKFPLETAKLMVSNLRDNVRLDNSKPLQGEVLSSLT